MTGCRCDFPAECNGTGVLHCDGCGGDLCVCVCGGEASCNGCEACEVAVDEYEGDEIDLLDPALDE